jgi:hypothetical protein
VSASDRSDSIIDAVGVLALGLYVAQGCLHYEWSPLVTLQQDDRYKVASGCVLALYLLHQSFVSRRRVFAPISALYWHKLAGALAPALLYLHASRFGFGYLLLLSSVFVGTIGIGLVHRIAMRAKWLFTTWFILHVATASSLVVLAGYHAVIALAYE